MRTQILGKRQTAVNKYLQQTKKLITRRRALQLARLKKLPKFQKKIESLWQRITCSEPGAPYDVCPTWYPTNADRNPWMAPG